jgi:hypothetical protein
MSRRGLHHPCEVDRTAGRQMTSRGDDSRDESESEQSSPVELHSCLGSDLRDERNVRHLTPHTSTPHPKDTHDHENTRPLLTTIHTPTHPQAPCSG